MTSKQPNPVIDALTETAKFNINKHNLKGGGNIEPEGEYLDEFLHENNNLSRFHIKATAFLYSKWN